MLSQVAEICFGDQFPETRGISKVEFVVGSAVKHAHDLVLGHYSVHTSAAALREGEARIQQIGNRLRAEGRLT